MALDKQKPSVHGVNASYHRVEGLSWDKQTSKVKIDLGGYAQVPEEGQIPLMRTFFELPVQAGDDISLAKVYAAIKLMADWSDSSDV